MKKIVTTILILTISIFTKAQVTDSTSCITLGTKGAMIDTLYTLCDTNLNPNFLINFEASANNIWQKGTTTKFGTTNARDTSCAIFTDSLSPYPINNYSAFNFLLPKNTNSFNYNYYLKFWHKFDTDSLLDGCWLEFSEDSGITWKKMENLNGGFQFQNGWNVCNLYNNQLSTNNFDSLIDGTKAWSGNSNGWRYTALWLNIIFPLKPERNNGINAIRFVFKSDSINNNKLGWIIDDFAVGFVDVGSSLNIYTLHNQLPVYPNPSNSGIFNISFPRNYEKGTLHVFNLKGQNIMEKELSSLVDLSQQPDGFYYYKAFFDNKVFSGVFNKN